MIRTGRAALSAAGAAMLATAVLSVAVTVDPPASTAAFRDVRIGDTTTYGESHVEDQTPAIGAPRSVFIIGDSGMVDEQVALEAAFHAAGAGHIELGAGPGIGLSQGFDWRGAWRGVIERDDPDLIIVMMGGWDMRFLYENGPDAYQRLLGEAVDLLSSGGARLLWLPMLPGGKGTWRTVDDVQINAVLATLPDLHPGVVFHPQVGASLLRPDGTYGISYVDDTGRTVLLRKPDGWHLCPEGAGRFAEEVLAAAVSLGLSPPAAAPWRDGPWVDAANFDDPRGACPR